MDTIFQRELAALINKYSMENGSDTPDFILADYLCGCLKTFERCNQRREGWFGRGVECRHTASTEIK